MRQRYLSLLIGLGMLACQTDHMEPKPRTNSANMPKAFGLGEIKSYDTLDYKTLTLIRERLTNPGLQAPGTVDPLGLGRTESGQLFIRLNILGRSVDYDLSAKGDKELVLRPRLSGPAAATGAVTDPDKIQTLQKALPKDASFNFALEDEEATLYTTGTGVKTSGAVRSSEGAIRSSEQRYTTAQLWAKAVVDFDTEETQAAKRVLADPTIKAPQVREAILSKDMIERLKTLHLATVAAKSHGLPVSGHARLVSSYSEAIEDGDDETIRDTIEVHGVDSSGRPVFKTTGALSSSTFTIDSGKIHYYQDEARDVISYKGFTSLENLSALPVHHEPEILGTGSPLRLQPPKKQVVRAASNPTD